jgi:NDP-sugar pyrophosphorylase family protein
MKAMIFAAGLGSRLKPLTNDKPKALVELDGEPFIAVVLKKLIDAGVNEVIINVHHFADLIKDYFKKNDFGIRIEFSDESRFLIDTGGGLKKAAHFFNDGKPFFAYNVDIATNINLIDLYNEHLESEALATLAVRNRESNRKLLFNSELFLSGWENTTANELVIVNENYKREELIPLAFSGVQVISPELLPMIAEVGKFSIIDVYLRLSKKEKIKAYIHDQDYWFDLGSINKLKEATNYIKELK